jgi:hypothetical protein
VCGIKLAENLPVAVCARLSDQEWEIKIFVRDGGEQKLRELLQSVELSVEEGTKLTYPARFSYSNFVEDIRPPPTGDRGQDSERHILAGAPVSRRRVTGASLAVPTAGGASS